MKVLGVSITVLVVLGLTRSAPLNSTLSTGRCEAQRQNCTIFFFCLECDSNGNFLSQQCSAWTGLCWCVNIFSGLEIENTRTPLGMPPDACHKLGNETRTDFAPAPTPGPDASPRTQVTTENPRLEPSPVCVNCNTTGGSITVVLTSDPVRVGSDSSEGSTWKENQVQHSSSFEYSPGVVYDCPDGWSPFGNQCFTFIKTPKTWVEAEVYCQFDKANLASVHSDEQSHFIMSLSRGETHNFPQTWLGGFDAIHPGYWMWSDGSEFDYENWSENDHKDHDKKSCLRINYDYDLKWFCASCTDLLPFVCVKNIFT